MSVNLNPLRPFNLELSDFNPFVKLDHNHLLSDPRVNKTVLRVVCVAFALLSPVIISGMVTVKTLRVISFYHFWNGENKNFSEKFKETGKDLLRIMLTIVGTVPLIFVSLGGVFFPFRAFNIINNFFKMHGTNLLPQGLPPSPPRPLPDGRGIVCGQKNPHYQYC